MISTDVDSITSNEANLRVPSKIVIDEQPQDTLANNGTVTFSCAFRTGAKPTIQWQKTNERSDFEDISGATNLIWKYGKSWTSSYSIRDVSLEIPGTRYRCKVSSGPTVVYSNAVGFNISDTPLISEIKPNLGDPSTIFRIYGKHFDGVKAIKISDVPVAFFSKISNNEILAVPSPNTRTGPVTVTNLSGIGTSRQNFSFRNPFCNVQIDKTKSLFINSRDVVNDKTRTQYLPESPNGGAWSFVGLMSQIAPPGADLQEFIRRWLMTWNTTTQINGFAVTPRDASKLTQYWPADIEGKLDLAKSPFRLLAITNRIDLRSPLPEHNSAGKVVFVFGLFEQKQSIGLGNPLKMWVSIEFDMRLEIHSLIEWTLLWYKLNQIQGNADSFNEALEKITRESTNLNPKISNAGHSPFSSLKTEEMQLENKPEFRQFRLNEESKLVPVPLKQNPDSSFNSNNKAELVQWVNDNLSAVNSDQFTIPGEFLAGAAQLPADFWLRHSNLPSTVENHFNRSTCTGCHQTESNNWAIHVSNRQENEISKTSNFLNYELLNREFDFKLLLMEMFCGQ